jgi:Lrp/AsnC family leucine-responsive transcriptional regulator
MVELDDIDRQLISLLQQDARQSFAALAEAVGLTTTPLRARVERLEASGVIRGYHADINPALVGYPIVAFVRITMKDHGRKMHQALVARIKKLESVIELHHVAGEEDLVLKVLVEKIDTFADFLLEELGAIGSVGRIKTNFVLSSPKARGLVPIGEALAKSAKKKRTTRSKSSKAKSSSRRRGAS